MTGSKGNHTLRISGKMKDKEISMLVDSGATNSFIFHTLVKQLMIPISPSQAFNVTVANVEKLQCCSTFESATWSMANKFFTTTTNVIPRGGHDIILGVKLMKTVSPLTFDFVNGSITIN